MSEREIRHFKYGRELIPTTLAGSDTCRLLIVTDDQIEIMSNLLNYAHDRKSWNDETINSETYYMPDDDTWDTLQALVDDLEWRLMSLCDFVTLDDVDERVGIGNDAPDAALDVVSAAQPIAKLTDGAGLGLVVDTGETTLDAENSITLDASIIDLQAAGASVLKVAEMTTQGSVAICGEPEQDIALKIVSESSGISPTIVLDNDTPTRAYILCGRSAGSNPGHLVLQSSSGKEVRTIYGLKVGTGFGCNSKNPQTAYTVNAASSDLATVIALCNQLRAALVANGICV